MASVRFQIVIPTVLQMALTVAMQMAGEKWRNGGEEVGADSMQMSKEIPRTGCKTVPLEK